MRSPTVISTFAGCGGSSLGYSLAGFRELLAVEWDTDAVTTFRLNFPDVPVYHGDIAKLSVENALELARIKPGELDVFDGSPPCQGFSTAGARKFTDPRNALFKEFVRLLAGLQPKVFVMENVTGMIKGVMKQAYLMCVRELRLAGYRVRGEVLNAMYYGVPQSRQRVIIIGVRDDLGVEPSHPKPQTRPQGVREALGWEEDLQIRQEWGRVGTPRPASAWRSADKPSPTLMKAGPPIIRRAASANRRGWGPRGPMGGVKNKQFNNSWRSLDLPSPTLEKTRPPIIKVGSDERELTLEECVILASFPKSFKWGPKAYQRIGNSVPPNLMMAIAAHIRTEILDRLEPASASARSSAEQPTEPPAESGSRRRGRSAPAAPASGRARATRPARS